MIESCWMVKQNKLSTLWVYGFLKTLGATQENPRTSTKDSQKMLKNPDVVGSKRTKSVHWASPTGLW